MHTVMGNEGTRSIKKQIFLSLGLFFSFSQLGAMCPQTVGSISTTEGVWSLLSRIGVATNVIESQICALDACVCGTSGSVTSNCNIDCSFSFGQAQIPLTISTPGTYCMTENISFAAGTAITVSSNDVTIDMKGHTLNGGDNAVTGILLSDGVVRVTIQNGIIEHIGGAAPNGIAIRDTVGAVTLMQNITIRDMSFNFNIDMINFNQAAAAAFDVTNLLVENCTGYNSGGIRARCLNGIVRGCSLEENKGDVFEHGIFLHGRPTAALAESLLIQDCVSISATRVNRVGIQIGTARNATIRSCLVSGSSDATPGPNGTGIRCDTSKLVTIQDCIVSDCRTDQAGIEVTALPGLTFGSETEVLIESCVSRDNFGFNPGRGCGIKIHSGGSMSNRGGYEAIVLNNCVADNNTETGIQILNNNIEGLNYQGIALRDCHASSNQVCGFILSNFNVGTGAGINNARYDGCTAQTNAGGGFIVRNGATSLQVLNIRFRNCVAQLNANAAFWFVDATTFPAHGFGISTSNTEGSNVDGVQLISCTAQFNSVGFGYGPLSINCQSRECEANTNSSGFINSGAGNRFFSCSAWNNGANFTGVTNTFAYAALSGGTGYYSNISG